MLYIEAKLLPYFYFIFLFLYSPFYYSTSLKAHGEVVIHVDPSIIFESLLSKTESHIL